MAFRSLHTVGCNTIHLISWAFRYYRSLLDFGVAFAMLTLPLSNSDTLDTLKDSIMVKYFNNGTATVPVKRSSSISFNHIVERWKYVHALFLIAFVLIGSLT